MTCVNCMLVFRLVNQNTPVPDIKLNIRNRDKQLCKPLLRLFQDSNVISEISNTLSKLLAEKRQRRSDTLDAKLFEIIINLIGEYGLELDNKMIWQAVMSNIEGHYDENKPLSYQTEEFYKISQKMVTDILVDKFGAIKGHDSTGNKRVLRFNQDILNRLSFNYATAKEIEIVKTSDGSDTSDRCTDSKEDIREEEIDTIEHEIGLKQPENEGVSVYNPSDPSETSHVIHRLGTSDKWYCDNCNYREDRHFFDRSDCPRNKK